MGTGFRTKIGLKM